MKYDFHKIIDRTDKDALALDMLPFEAEIKPGFSRIPMWIADMSFETVPAVPQALIDRASHGAYGYFQPRKAYYDAIIGWQKAHNGVEGLCPEHIGYENGVLGGVISTLGAICSPGDAVLIHSPTYIGFTHSLTNHGYRIVLSPLQQDGDGIWRMDFADMDKKLKEHSIRAAIFCSPHNPTGRVWERSELEQAMEIYRQNGVYVISDEIWSDMTLFGHKHIPTQSVSEDARNRTVALYAPSKTFNLAGLVGSYHIIYNDWLRARVDKEGSLSHYNNMNVLSMHALIAAYSDEGGEWLCELREVLGENITYMRQFLAQAAPEIECACPQGTYMLFLDCEKWLCKHGMTLDELLGAGAEVGVLWQDGRPFHGEHHIRVNLALPMPLLTEACARLKTYVFNK